MTIVRIPDAHKTDYMDLLLLADEQRSMVDRNLWRGEMYVLDDDGVKAECVVTQEGADRFEIKNIATVPEFQGNGYGKALIAAVSALYKRPGAVLYVGTGECPSTMEFYKRCGFVESHRVKNFFVDNYDHPIIEDGRRLVDMIYLKKKL